MRIIRMRGTLLHFRGISANQVGFATYALPRHGPAVAHRESPAVLGMAREQIQVVHLHIGSLYTLPVLKRGYNQICVKIKRPRTAALAQRHRLALHTPGSVQVKGPLLHHHRGRSPQGQAALVTAQFHFARARQANVQRGCSLHVTVCHVRRWEIRHHLDFFIRRRPNARQCQQPQKQKDFLHHFLLSPLKDSLLPLSLILIKNAKKANSACLSAHLVEELTPFFRRKGNGTRPNGGSLARRM